MLKCWAFMNWRLIYFCTLCFLSLRFNWCFSIPTGWSSVSFPITTSSSPAQVFGTSLSKVEEIVSLDGQRFTFWSTNSTNQSNILTQLSPDKGYFIKSNGTFELSDATVFSLLDYPLTTGFQLIPLKSGETLSSLTNSSEFSSRIYAVAGLHANHWYISYPGNNLSYSEAVSEALDTTSVSPLLELTPGFAYFIGLRPLLKRVSIQSVRLNSKIVRGAKYKFSTINQVGSADSFFLNDSSFKLGAALSNDQGEWSGDIFVPYESQTLISQWQAVKGAQGVNDSDLVSGEFMFSTYRLDSTTAVETIPRINFSPLTNLVYFQRLKDLDSRQDYIAANVLSQLVEQESVGFSDFNTSPLQLFSNGVNENNPLHQTSFTGRNSSALESTVVDLSHQVANSLIERIFNNSNQLLDSLSSLNEAKSKPFQTISQQFLNALRNGLDSYTDSNPVLVELNNYGGPNLRLISREFSGDTFLTLNAIEVGNQSARIETVEDQLAYLVPVDSGTQFTFDEYPEFLRIPLGSYNALNEVTGKMRLSLFRRNSSQPPFAHVTANHFTIALKDIDDLCPFSSSSTQKHQMCVQIDNDSAINFHYQYLHNGFPLTGSGTNINSLDSGDTNLSKVGFIEIPILGYVRKAGNISERFRDLDLELIISFEGFKFALNGYSDQQFAGFRVANLRINSP